MEKEKKRTLLRLFAVLLILAPTVVILLVFAFREGPTPSELAACEQIRIESEGEMARELKKGEDTHTLLTGLLSLCKEETLDAVVGKRYTVTADGMEAKLSLTESGHLSVEMDGETYGIRLSPLTGENGALAPALVTYAYVDGERFLEGDAERRDSAYYAESTEEIAALVFENAPSSVKVLVYEVGSEQPLCTLDTLSALSLQSLNVNKSYQIYVSAEVLREGYRIRYVYEFYLNAQTPSSP